MGVSADDVTAEAAQLITTVQKMGKLPNDLKHTVLAHIHQLLSSTTTTLKDIEARRTIAVNDKNAAVATFKSYKTRVLSAVRGIYGPDSNEYEAVGGKRRSEKKKGLVRKKKGKPAAPAPTK